MRVRLLLAAASLLAACTGDDFSVVGDTSSTPDGGVPPGAPPALPPNDGGSTVDSGLPPCGAPNTACCAGNTCSGGAQCNGTICACPTGQTACGTTCVDTKSDAQSCGRCGHDCLGGTCGDSKCTAYTVTPSQVPVYRVLPSGGRLYWTRGLTSTSGGGFFSSKLDGTDLVTIFDAGTANACTGGAIAGGKAYFICSNGVVNDIRQCTIPCGAASSTVLKPGIANVSALATDPAAGTLYYAVSTPYGQAPNGGIFDIAGNRVGAASQPNPNDLVVANGSVFWLNSGTYASDIPQFNGGVKRASLASIATEVVVVGAGNNYFDNGRLAVDANDVYYTGRDYINGDGDIIIANATATGAFPTIFANSAGGNVVSDGTNVFFDDPATTSIRYCSRTAGCGAGRTLLSANEGATAITLDTDSVIWAKGNGEIRRIAKP
jgi:hypothetical protein